MKQGLNQVVKICRAPSVGGDWGEDDEKGEGEVGKHRLVMGGAGPMENATGQGHNKRGWCHCGKHKTACWCVECGKQGGQAFFCEECFKPFHSGNRFPFEPYIIKAAQDKGAQ